MGDWTDPFSKTTPPQKKKKTAHTEHEHTQVIIDFRSCQRGSRCRTGDEKENNRSVRCGHEWKLSISTFLHKQLTARKATKAPTHPPADCLAWHVEGEHLQQKNETKLTLRSGLATSGRTHMTGRIRCKNLILAQQFFRVPWSASWCLGGSWRSERAERYARPKEMRLSVCQAMIKRWAANCFCRTNQTGYEPTYCCVCVARERGWMMARRRDGRSMFPVRVHCGSKTDNTKEDKCSTYRTQSTLRKILIYMYFCFEKRSNRGSLYLHVLLVVVEHKKSWIDVKQRTEDSTVRVPSTCILPSFSLYGCFSFIRSAFKYAPAKWVWMPAYKK